MALVSVVVSAAAALIYLTTVRRLPVVAPMIELPVWALAMLFAVAEMLFVPLRMRRSSHGFSLSEIPLVIGLGAVSPTGLVIARFAGSTSGLLFSRVQRGFKLIFNVALMVLETCVAIVVYYLLMHGEPPATPRGWLAALVTVIVVDLLSATLVTAAMVVHDDPSEWRQLLRAWLRGVPPAVASASIALVALLALRQNAYVGVLLLLVTGIAYVANQRYIGQSEAHTRVQRLYGFTHRLGGELETDDIVRTVLTSAREELRAEVAELILPTSTENVASSWRLTATGLQRQVEPRAQSRWWSGALSGTTVLLPSRTLRQGGPAETGEEIPEDGMAVPLLLGKEQNAVLAVSHSLSDIGSNFGPEDLRLFEAMANHAAVSLANARLVQQLRQTAAEQEYNALHDALTGLPNRRYFSSELEQALMRQGEHLLGVILLDLDEFKDVNDTLGHDIGDRLLVEVGSRLQAHVGDRGMVARLGGDEYAVLLTDPGTAEELRVLGLEILSRVESPFVLDQLTLDVRASAGVALAPEHGQDTRTLLAHADVAMYGAKSARTRLELYRPEYDRNSRRRLTLLGSLERAISSGELVLAYQPKIQAKGGGVIGVEALVRWDHPDQGRILPEEFVPLAEHSGLIRPLTAFVLETALRQCAEWRAEGHLLSVAVNLSTRSLLDTAMPDDVKRLLEVARLPADALTLEITESSFISDAARSVEILDRIAALGVCLSVDDFGTGYSSLAYLQRLPFREIKIDKGFVLRLTSEGGDQAIVSAIVRLSHELGLTVVAEGVEDLETLRFLQRQNCDVVQGYLFSRPLPALEMRQWLTRRREANVLRSGSGGPGTASTATAV